MRIRRGARGGGRRHARRDHDDEYSRSGRRYQSGAGARASVAISFTVETDGRLPTGDALGDAISAVDAATGGYPAYYMINCAHPAHFDAVLDAGAAWTARIGGVRANASRLSHAELDVMTELDIGDPADLAARHRALIERFPQIRVVGGCCGTDLRHVRRLPKPVWRSGCQRGVRA
jgi:homocysteine S-methyltransferase